MSLFRYTVEFVLIFGKLRETILNFELQNLRELSRKWQVSLYQNFPQKLWPNGGQDRFLILTKK